MVFIVEFGFYVSDCFSVLEGQFEIDDCWKGIGICIEDDVVVIEIGYEVFIVGVFKSVVVMEC